MGGICFPVTNCNRRRSEEKLSQLSLMCYSIWHKLSSSGEGNRGCLNLVLFFPLLLNFGKISVSKEGHKHSIDYSSEFQLSNTTFHQDERSCFPIDKSNNTFKSFNQ